LTGAGSIMPRLRRTRAPPPYGCRSMRGSNNKQPSAAGAEGEKAMADSVYKIIELVGTSTESWEKAAAVALNQAAKSLRDLRIAEVVQLDMQVQNGKVKAYRAKLKVSFKFEGQK
jgi:flavin-binding protein dodecin